jgi:ribosome biogenesis GTPase A
VEIDQTNIIKTKTTTTIESMTRKKVFGNAKKKEQLQAKREQKRLKSNQEWDWNEAEYKPLPKQQPQSKDVTSAITNSQSKLRTYFEKESQDVIDERIRQSRLPLKRTSTNSGEVHYTSIDMPIRPAWNKTMSTAVIEKQEEIYFAQYLDSIYSNYSRSRLNHFEHNLNVWRQLWRVIELSDICLLVADIRHPLFHFPQSLYRHVTEVQKKPLILVLNKCDLVGEEQTQKWIDYFNQNYPLLKVVAFSAYTSAVHDEKEKRTRRRKKQVDYNLVHKIWQACKSIELQNKENKESYYRELIQQAEEKMNQHDDESDDDEDENGETIVKDELVDKKNLQEHIEELERTAANTITVGLIGHPNTGKSCLLNGLVGRTVVSASYTPGHTKHFQTYFVSKHVRLCDSPGLVFPAINMPRALQVLCGIFPIAQVREPYSAIQYLAERVPLEKIYKLNPPEDEGFTEWSAWAICEAYAIKRGYTTTKMARPDVYRAANEILRETLYGFPVLLAFDPPEGKVPERSLEELKQETGLEKSSTLVTTSKKDDNSDSEEEASEEESPSEEEDNADDEEYEEHGTGNVNPFSVLAEE